MNSPCGCGDCLGWAGPDDTSKTLSATCVLCGRIYYLDNGLPHEIYLIPARRLALPKEKPDGNA